ncbi:MAG: ABC transporter ATP-binding protein [Desulfurococcales archaeon]|nr:ABC transporter ATP-binding protein [Desulfurococcales archaeon]
MNSLAVEVKGLRKVFKDVVAVKDISFTVNGGEVFGLVGPNGAGKTTTLRILATILKPTSGSVRIFGKDVVKETDAVRRMISYLPEEAGAYKYLTGYEYLRLMSRVYGKGDEALEDGIKLSGLGDALNRYVSTYSKGMKRRLQVARTLMVRPRLAIMDEPTSGLDVVHAVYLRDAIREYVRRYGITVILSSHNMLEVEYLCDRVALVNKGRIALVGKPQDLMAEYGAKNLEEVFVRVVRNA